MGCDIHMQIERRNADGTWSFVEPPGHGWFEDRNYNLFAMLTGTVRNSIGDHGIVDRPRGLPRDIDPETSESDLGDHSQGWLALDEILAFDWDAEYDDSGIVSLAEFAEWRDVLPRRSPASYCKGVSGPDVVLLHSAREAVAMLANGSPAGRQVYVCVDWKQSRRSAATRFLRFVNETLLPLGNPADTRLVFGFDS